MLQNVPYLSQICHVFVRVKVKSWFCLQYVNKIYNKYLKGRTTLPSAFMDPNGLMAKGMSRYESVLALSCPHYSGRQQRNIILNNRIAKI